MFLHGCHEGIRVTFQVIAACQPVLMPMLTRNPLALELHRPRAGPFPAGGWDTTGHPLPMWLIPVWLQALWICLPSPVLGELSGGIQGVDLAGDIVSLGPHLACCPACPLSDLGSRREYIISR